MFNLASPSRVGTKGTPVSNFSVRTKGVEEIFYENGSVFVKRSGGLCDVIIHPCGMGEVLRIDESVDLEKQLVAATGRGGEKKEKKPGPKTRDFRGVLKL